MRPSSGFVASPRTLIVALIGLALLPNLSVAAYLWLPALQRGSAEPVVPAAKPASLAEIKPAALAETKPAALTETKPAALAEMSPADAPRPAGPAAAKPVLTAPATLEASASADIGLPIALDGTDGMPARSVIAVSGLPEGATLSNGRPYGATGWNLKSDEIGDLQLHVPDRAGGETRIAIELVAPQGEILASAETVLKVTASPEIEPEPEATTELADASAPDVTGSIDTGAPAPKMETAAGQPDTPPQTAKAEATAAAQPQTNGGDPAASPSRGAKPMTLASADAAPDTSGGEMIEPAMYVNLRKDPNSAAAVLGVVPKGAKLSVLDRKRGWVQVTDPGTAQKGWIYAGNLTGAPKRVRRSAKATDDEASIWSRMGDWLGGGGASAPDATAH